MRHTATRALAVLLVATVLTSGAVAGVTTDQTDGEAYAGAHVEFEVTSNAIADYAVDGSVVFDEVRVESGGSADTGIGAGTDVSLATDVEGTGLSLSAESETRATVGAEGGGEIRAHDNERAQLVVDASDENASVAVEVNGEAEAGESGDRVVVERDGGTGTFLVVGDGDVRVDAEGNVVAELDGGSDLVYRHNGETRDEEDSSQEELIADGEAVAELFVVERDGETVVESVEYAGDVTVETRSRAEGELRVAVERTTDRGTVVLTEVSESVVGAVESADDVAVTVDGEASARAESYQELRSTVAGDEGTSYYVTSATNADASAAVLVAISGFSERTVAVRDADGSSDGSGDDSTDGGTTEETTDGGTTEDASDGGSDAQDTPSGSESDEQVPGFGVTAALVAVLSVLAYLRR